MRSLDSWAAGVLLAVLAFGLAMLPLLSPSFTRALSGRYSIASPRAEAAATAEATRRFVVSGSSESRAVLSAVMTEDAVSHLDDVRRVIRGGLIVTAALAVLLAVWIAVSLAWRREVAVAKALRIGSAAAAAAVVLPAVMAIVDFDSFFAAFHALFFEPGTWVFPSDSLLIRLFPEAFWITSAIVWGALTLLIAVLFMLAAALLERRHGTSVEDEVR